MAVVIAVSLAAFVLLSAIKHAQRPAKPWHTRNPN